MDEEDPSWSENTVKVSVVDVSSDMSRHGLRFMAHIPSLPPPDGGMGRRVSVRRRASATSNRMHDTAPHHPLPLRATYNVCLPHGSAWVGTTRGRPGNTYYYSVGGCHTTVALGCDGALQSQGVDIQRAELQRGAAGLIPSLIPSPQDCSSACCNIKCVCCCVGYTDIHTYYVCVYYGYIWVYVCMYVYVLYIPSSGCPVSFYYILGPLVFRTGQFSVSYCFHTSYSQP